MPHKSGKRAYPSSKGHPGKMPKGMPPKDMEKEHEKKHKGK